MRITAEGQVTIPQALREKYGLDPHSEVEFIDMGDGVALRKVGATQGSFEQWMHTVAGSANAGLSTDEIMHMTRGED